MLSSAAAGAASYSEQVEFSGTLRGRMNGTGSAAEQAQLVRPGRLLRAGAK